MKYTIYWLRRDLRIEDNLCIKSAIELDLPILFLYIYHFDDKPYTQKIFDKFDENRIGGASKWWLHHSLTSLSNDLNDKLKAKLIIKTDNIINVFKELIANQNYQIKNIIFSEQYDLYSISEEEKLQILCKQHQINFYKINNSCLTDIKSDNLYKSDKSYYKIYTPFKKNILEKTLHLIKKNASYDLSKIKTIDIKIKSESIENLNLLPTKPNWAINFKWEVGEKSAIKKLNNFLESKIKSYKQDRDFPEIDGTSQLSPHLAFGEISPWKIFNATYELLNHLENNSTKDSALHFISEVIWREFAYYIHFNFPEFPYKNFNSKFNKLEWNNNLDYLNLWENSKTGFPIIDAAMNQLWQTGWMHNRLRMIVGSLLTKNLLIDWRFGAHYFFDTLVDYDIANNSFGWQWISGHGADAAPYFRIFNPNLQSEKFDQNGAFIKKYLPILSNIDTKILHNPETIHKSAKVDRFTKANYRKPMVDLDKSRKAALEAFKNLK